MHIGIPKESKHGEKRVSVTPDVVKDFVQKGYRVSVENHAGEAASFSDEKYKEAGASIASRQDVFDCDVVLKINPPTREEVEQMKAGGVLISLMYHLTNPERIEDCCRRGISVFSLDAIPRISRAQKMDVLSSQANLAGYKAVLLAANTIGKILPMMTTAAGTIRPCKVVIFGAGVAGLQAIATAKRLGAVVEVTDIRPETKEQVESLGAKFIEVKADNSIKIEGGYVKNVSDEFLRKQQELVAKHVKEADIVITTALIPGKKAPLLVTQSMVESMRPGSVILDMAVEQGGNVAGSEPNKTIVKNGVTIIGEANLPSLLPTNASELFARNIQAFLYHISDSKNFKWDMQDEITRGSLIVRDGNIVHESLLKPQNA